MSTFVEEKPTQNLEAFKGVKKVPHEEYYTSGHRTCQGCGSAQIMKLMAKRQDPKPSFWVARGACTWPTPRFTRRAMNSTGCVIISEWLGTKFWIA
jgi:pyruvate/2-oxoacid:ferredoxin oxidoreductase beta subunit